VFLGNPEYGVQFAPMDSVKFAEACGARGIRIEDPNVLAPVERRARRDGPWSGYTCSPRRCGKENRRNVNPFLD